MAVQDDIADRIAGFAGREGSRATRRLRARFASRAQTRSHYVIRISDAATQFEMAIGDIADCSGSEG